MTLPATKPRGRKRSVAAEAAILSAASELLEMKSLRDVTAEAIAERAGTSKATIYKWWPNKNHVALDAFLKRTQAEIPTSDTGCALRDFTDQLILATRFYKSPRGRLLTQFIAEGQNDPELLRLFRERFLKQRRQSVRAIWEKAVARGEIRADVECELFIDLMYSPLVYRLLVGHNPLSDADAAAVVEAVFPRRRGVRQGEASCDDRRRSRIAMKPTDAFREGPPSDSAGNDSWPTLEEHEELRRRFAPTAARFRRIERILPWLGFGLVISFVTMSATFPWGLPAFVSILVSLAVLGSINTLKCPRCAGNLGGEIRRFCPTCGDPDIERAGVFRAARCRECNVFLHRTKRGRSYRVHACTHCGIWLDDEGL